jgi:hypothetical protein
MPGSANISKGPSLLEKITECNTKEYSKATQDRKSLLLMGEKE